MLYAERHNGMFPDSWDEVMVESFYSQPLLFPNPTSGEPMSVEYITGLSVRSSGGDIVLATPLLDARQRICLFVDGSVRLVTEKDYARAVKGLPVEQPRR
jgi:hypothetical protein